MSAKWQPLWLAAITRSHDPLDVRLAYSLGYAVEGLGKRLHLAAVRYSIRRKA